MANHGNIPDEPREDESDRVEGPEDAQRRIQGDVVGTEVVEQGQRPEHEAQGDRFEARDADEACVPPIAGDVVPGGARPVPGDHHEGGDRDRTTPETKIRGEGRGRRTRTPSDECVGDREERPEPRRHENRTRRERSTDPQRRPSRNEDEGRTHDRDSDGRREEIPDDRRPGGVRGNEPQHRTERTHQEELHATRPPDDPEAHRGDRDPGLPSEVDHHHHEPREGDHRPAEQSERRMAVVPAHVRVESLTLQHETEQERRGDRRRQQIQSVGGGPSPPVTTTALHDEGGERRNPRDHDRQERSVVREVHHGGNEEQSAHPERRRGARRRWIARRRGSNRPQTSDGRDDHERQKRQPLFRYGSPLPPGPREPGIDVAVPPVHEYDHRRGELAEDGDDQRAHRHATASKSMGEIRRGETETAPGDRDRRPFQQQPGGDEEQHRGLDPEHQ